MAPAPSSPLLQRPASQQVLLTPKQMQELDRRTIEELGVPGQELMQAAASACVGVIQTRWLHLLAKGVLILCGPGKNGGDGLAIARLLAAAGHAVEVLLLQPPAGLRGDAAAQLEMLRNVGIEPEILSLGSRDLPSDNCSGRGCFGLVIDALFGMGLARDLDGVAADLVALTQCCREAGSLVLSVDIPSGIHGASGQALGAAVSADLTVTFAAAKRGHFQEPGRSARGELVIADIGVAVQRWPELVANASTLLSASSLIDASPAASEAAHKGSFGHVLVVAGGPGKSGAARLCAEAALRGGAGLVTLVIAKDLALDSLAELRPEVMIERVPGTPDGRLSTESLGAVLQLCASRDVLAVGPGIGTEQTTCDLIGRLFSSVDLPAVFDADALNCLAQNPPSRGSSAARIITPHPGESARLLLQLDAARPVDRVDEARLLARSFDCVAVLKGAGTVIADPTGRNAINPTGNVGMATAGSGDVLTGVIAGLLARGAEPFAAACGGVFWHGHAGDLVANRLGPFALLAGDLSESLGAAWTDLNAGE